MLRLLLLAPAALILPACSGGDDTIQVANIGADTVIVSISFDEPWGDHGHDVFEVPPGVIARKDYDDGTEVEVLIYRKSDGLILFAADFDEEDFDDDHSTIEITVAP